MKPLLAAPLMLCLALLPAWAQQADGKLSDAERAKRDAEKVFSFIKFHTVKPAAAAAPAPKPAPAPAAAARSMPVAAAAAAAPRATVPATAAAAPVAASAVRNESQAAARGVEAPVAAPAEPVAAAPAPAVQAAVPAAPVAATTQPVAEPAAEPEEEVALKLIAYVAPDMSAQVMAAMPSNQVVVPVRFTVQPDGRVSSAQAMSNAPRRIANSAVRAVQQWRFEPIPAVREVDVEIAFKAAE